jgi:hypothetical protein
MSIEGWIVLVLVLLWLTGYLAFPGIGALLHILLVVALVVIIVAAVKSIRRIP